MLKAEGLKKSYGSLPVLKGVDIEINKGEVVSIVGASGAGKSTLVKGVAGIYPFDSGEYLFDGQPQHGGQRGEQGLDAQRVVRRGGQRRRTHGGSHPAADPQA